MSFAPLLAHHVEINLFDILVIEPETMPEHAVLSAVSAVVIGFIVYGIRAAVRDLRTWLAGRRDLTRRAASPLDASRSWPPSATPRPTPRSLPLRSRTARPSRRSPVAWAAVAGEPTAASRPTTPRL